MNKFREHLPHISVLRKLTTNCLSEFDHFVGLVLKGLREPYNTGPFLENSICWVDLKAQKKCPIGSKTTTTTKIISIIFWKIWTKLTNVLLTIRSNALVDTVTENGCILPVEWNCAHSTNVAGSLRIINWNSSTYTLN